MADFTITVKDVTRIYSITDSSLLTGIEQAMARRNEGQSELLDDGSPNPEFFKTKTDYMNNVFGVWGESNYVTDDSLDEVVNRALNSWRAQVVIPVVGRDPHPVANT